jgi:hypothetical protein
MRETKMNGQQSGSPGGLFTTNPKQALAPESRPPETRAPAAHEDDEILTDEQVMRILKVKRQWLRDHTTRVEPIIPHMPMGREIRYSKRALYSWLGSLIETRPSWERNEKAA